MRLLRLFALAATISLAACGGTKTVVSDQQKFTRVDQGQKRDANSTEVDAMSSLDLTAYLRRIPGMQIQGTGQSAVVRVRDQRSSMSETAPLFVVDGNILGNDFAALYSSIDPNEIARIKVLKSASETNRYGLQGGNGVVEIKLKK